MPGWLTEVLKLFGFTTPFVYAAATYGVFHWLDKKASGPAKRALTARLQSQPPDKESLANFALEVFDRIYSKPLLSLRAFCRSAVITIVVCAMVWLEMLPRPLNWETINNLTRSSLVINVCTDYVSLFFVRKLLSASRRRPALGLTASFLVAGIVVFFTYAYRVGYYVFFPLEVPFSVFLSFVFSSYGIGLLIEQWVLSIPAVAVHLWLPLLALAIVLTQASGWFFKAVGWMQWFLKQGQHHPFQAVGYVASAIVFASGVVIQYVWR